MGLKVSAYSVIVLLVTFNHQRVIVTQLLLGGNLKGYLDATAMNARYCMLCTC